MLDLNYYAMVDAFFTHELDATKRHEWRILPLTSFLPDSVGEHVFIWLHIPLFALLLLGGDGDPLRATRIGVSVFAIVHVGLPALFLAHPASEFDTVGSWSLAPSDRLAWSCIPACIATVRSIGRGSDRSIAVLHGLRQCPAYRCLASERTPKAMWGRACHVYVASARARRLYPPRCCFSADRSASNTCRIAGAVRISRWTASHTGSVGSAVSTSRATSSVALDHSVEREADTESGCDGRELSRPIVAAHRNAHVRRVHADRHRGTLETGGELPLAIGANEWVMQKLDRIRGRTRSREVLARGDCSHGQLADLPRDKACLVGTHVADCDVGLAPEQVADVVQGDDADIQPGNRGEHVSQSPHVSYAHMGVPSLANSDDTCLAAIRSNQKQTPMHKRDFLKILGGGTILAATPESAIRRCSGKVARRCSRTPTPRWRTCGW